MLTKHYNMLTKYYNMLTKHYNMLTKHYTMLLSLTLSLSLSIYYINKKEERLRWCKQV
jgi:hypothetical protein